MTMNLKEKELVAIGISVAAGCKPCTDHHVTVARKARATGDEIRQAINDAVVVKRSTVDLIEDHALTLIGEDLEVIGCTFSSEPSRITALVSVGSAIAVNCVSSLEYYLAEAEVSGMTEDDIMKIVDLAALIKQRAASHVERYMSMTEKKIAA